MPNSHIHAYTPTYTAVGELCCAITQEVMRDPVVAQGMAVHTGSLVPRPFLPPAFDHLQNANIEGEGLGDLITCGYVG